MNDHVMRNLKNDGFTVAEIEAAISTAEINGQAPLGGWLIRHNDRGELITLHPSWGGIYVGDYKSHIHFQKNLSYTYGGYGFMNAKHGDLEKVLQKLDAAKTNGFILCECMAYGYERRKKQVEKLGYKVYKTNIAQCDRDTSTCVFLIA